MGGITGSLIQPWIDLHDSLDNLPSEIPPCYGLKSTLDTSPNKEISCAVACTDSIYTGGRDGVKNLLPCGLFASVALLPSYLLHSPGSESYLNAYSSRFQEVGLDISNTTQGFLTSNIITDFFSGQYAHLKTGLKPINPNFDRINPCARLFLVKPISESVDAFDFLKRIGYCMDAICGPKQVEEDLGGIGVFSSLLLQLCFCILLCLAPPIIEIFCSYTSQQHKRRRQKIATALVEFHKSQCYFISAIHIATLYLLAILEGPIGERGFGIKPALPFPLALAFCMSGLIPITVTLVTIARYARLTWHIIVMSLITLILPTAGLGITTRLIYISEKVDCFDNGPCNDPQSQRNVELLCGAHNVGLNQFPRASIAQICLAWVAWLNSFLWTSGCIIQHICNRAGSGNMTSFNAMILRSTPDWARILVKISKSEGKIFMLLLALFWTPCFALAFYLYQLMTAINILSKTWTFGQVISVTFWAPFLVELIYIEYKGIELGSRYKYPPGLQVTDIDEKQDATYVSADEQDALRALELSPLGRAGQLSLPSLRNEMSSPSQQDVIH